MKKILNICIATFLVLGTLSCDKMLDPTTDGALTEEDIWGNYKRAFGFLNNAYTNLNGGYNRISSTMLATATDDAICPNPSNTINDFTNGAWNSYNLVEDVWYYNYAGIRKVNTFLEEIDSVPLPLVDSNIGTKEDILNSRARMKGEAYFLRALFHFELVKRYGSIPLVNKVLTTDEALNISQSSSDSCFQFIFNDCDSAMARLPYYYGEIPSIVGYNDAKDMGRATYGAALALKAKAQLFWASPLFNATGDKERWLEAANSAKEVIDLKDDNGSLVYELISYTSTDISDLFAPTAITPLYNSEIIFSTKYNENNTVEQQNAPISFGGNAMVAPTQDLVEAFPMLNGKSITDAGSLYDAQNPYENRDLRLAMTVLYNGIDYSINDRNGKLESYTGGADGADAYATASPTSYYLNKFMSDQAVWDGRTVKNSRTWIHLRFSEMYLIYAEAINEYNGDITESKAYLTKIRRKLNLRAIVPTPVSSEEMRKLIQNERRIELAFEENRFFDVRRWRLYDDLEERKKYENVRGCKITKNGDNTFSYDPTLVVRNRLWDDRMYLYPIPQVEVMKSSNLTQNPGW